MKIMYNVTGSDRKRLVEELSSMLGWSAVYCGAPTFSYKVGNYTVNKNGMIELPDSATRDIAGRIIDKLKDKGFIPVSTEYDALTIELPRSQFTAESVERLETIVESKAELFKHAFKTSSIMLDISNDTIGFPWFHLHDIDGETAAYSRFIAAIGLMARVQKRVSTKPYHGDNDKFAMRIFLIRLGFNGAKNKQLRKILMMNLEGNSAWKNGPPLEGR